MSQVFLNALDFKAPDRVLLMWCHYSIKIDFRQSRLNKSMNIKRFGSIKKIIFIIVFSAVLPVFLTLIFTNIKNKQQTLENAQKDVFLLTNSIVHTQEVLTASAKQLLSSLAALPTIKHHDTVQCGEIFKNILKSNTNYQNITLTGLNGNVLASGLPINQSINLSDRKHFRDAIAKKSFSVGEYIVTRVGQKNNPAIPFAFPVLDENGQLNSILTIAVNLSQYSTFIKNATLPDKSILAITDYKGIRLHYYPESPNTNPIGKAIKPSALNKVIQANHSSGSFRGQGSDGIHRIYAFEPIFLESANEPYMVVWAALPETYIFAPVNKDLFANILTMIFATIISFSIAWFISRKLLVFPIQSLSKQTKLFADGQALDTQPIEYSTGEIGNLTKSFYEMAHTLNSSQSALKENEARFRILMDSIESIIYVADMDTYEVLFINAYAKKLLGDITGKICWQTIQQGQDGPCSFCTNKYLLNTDGSPKGLYSWEFQNTITDQWFYINDRAIQWIDGRIVRLEIAIDITERKEAEQKLEEEREQLAVTLGSIGEGVITTNIDYEIALMNEIAEKHTGWDSDEAIGMSLFDVFKMIDEKDRTPMSFIPDLSDDQYNISFIDNAILIAKNGEEKHITVTVSPIRTNDENTIGFVIVFRDISDQIKTENELMKIKKLESVGVLAGGIAHDFNNILSSIIGSVDLSLKDLNLSEKTNNLLNETLKASYRAKDLTQQLLTFSKGGQPIKETASIEEVIKDSAKFVLHGDTTTCQFDFSEDLWLVNADKGQISQVIQNLIINASHAMPHGGTIHVKCRNTTPDEMKENYLSTEHRYVKIEISDQGIGIPTDMIDKIFDPYFTTKSQGSGLGLAITHSIITKHGGYIFANSTPDIGTTFTLYLPASDKELKSLEEKTENNQTFKKLKILVMDDDAQLLELFKLMLEDLGHKVSLSIDGKSAIQTFIKARNDGSMFDLIIMDLTIPGGMGGMDAFKEIRKIDQEVKVIVSSGYSNDPTMANYRDHGFSAALPKPFNFSAISKVLIEIAD